MEEKQNLGKSVPAVPTFGNAYGNRYGISFTELGRASVNGIGYGIQPCITFGGRDADDES